MSDPRTIGVYDAQAETYAKLTQADARHPTLEAFAEALPEGARILDLGCGPGTAAGALAARGFAVEAVDASGEMVARAAQLPGVEARQAAFDDIAGVAVYDGVWANFSLLHAAKADFPRHLTAISKALKPAGVFHIGLKLGQGEARDRLGRHYAYYSETELEGLLTGAGFQPIQRTHGRDPGLDGAVSDWITVLSKVNNDD